NGPRNVASLPPSVERGTAPAPRGAFALRPEHGRGHEPLTSQRAGVLALLQRRLRLIDPFPDAGAAGVRLVDVEIRQSGPGDQEAGGATGPADAVLRLAEVALDFID